MGSHFSAALAFFSGFVGVLGGLVVFLVRFLDVPLIGGAVTLKLRFLVTSIRFL